MVIYRPLNKALYGALNLNLNLLPRTMTSQVQKLMGATKCRLNVNSGGKFPYECLGLRVSGL